MQLALGVIWLALGTFYIARRNRLRARQFRLSGRSLQPPIVFAMLGALYVLIGVVWIVHALS